MENSLAEDYETSIIQKLFLALKEAKIEGFDRIEYIPRDAIQNIINFDSASAALNEISPDLTPQNIQKHANAICGSNGESRAACLFAILVLCCAASEIVPLLIQGITDADLPFRLDDDGDIQQHVDEQNYKNVDCCSSWDYVFKKQFIRYQDLILTPSISKRGPESGPLLEIKAIPTIDSKLVEWTSKREACLVKFHRAHHNLLPEAAPGNEPDFMLTRYFASKQDKLEPLLEKLQSFVEAERNHHVLQIPAWFNHWGQLHFVSFWSPTNMEEYWTEVNPSPSMDTDFAFWFATQWEGIADALSSIQNRPDMVFRKQSAPNRVTPVYIRWFSHDSFHGRFDKNGTFQVDIVSPCLDMANADEGRGYTATPQYVAEWDLSVYAEPEQTRGPNTIIWSLGCTILEAISSLLLGFRSLTDEFYPTLSTRKGVPDRRLYACSNSYYALDMSFPTGMKPEVAKWIHKLKKHSNCNRYLHELLDLVGNRMLLLEEGKRISLSDLRDTLKHIREESNKTADFRRSSHKNVILKLFGR